MPNTKPNYDVWITGDVHGNIKDLLLRLEKRGVPNTENQLVILLGDVGVNYYQNTKDLANKYALQASGRTYLCIHGNHEARPLAPQHTAAQQVWPYANHPPKSTPRHGRSGGRRMSHLLWHRPHKVKPAIHRHTGKKDKDTGNRTETYQIAPLRTPLCVRLHQPRPPVTQTALENEIRSQP